jgi:hypothetical protein
MAGEDDSYEVGYGKPPKSTRFAKGQSGNPEGRAKGSKNLATIVLQESRQSVRINGPRGSKTVTKLVAAVMQLGNKAARGELPALREFFALVQRSEEATASNTPPTRINELDQRALERLRSRMQRASADAPSADQTAPQGATE